MCRSASKTEEVRSCFSFLLPHVASLSIFFIFTTYFPSHTLFPLPSLLQVDGLTCMVNWWVGALCVCVCVCLTGRWVSRRSRWNKSGCSSETAWWWMTTSAIRETWRSGSGDLPAAPITNRRRRFARLNDRERKRMTSVLYRTEYIGWVHVSITNTFSNQRFSIWTLLRTKLN